MRNDGLLRYMVAVSDAGFNSTRLPKMTGYDVTELVVAYRTAALHGFMDDDGQITDAGNAWLNDNIAPRHVVTKDTVGVVTPFRDIYLLRHTTARDSFKLLESIMPPKVFAVMCECVGEQQGVEAFERRNDIPARSARVLISEGAELCKRIQERVA